MIVCRDCGTQNADDDVFCGGCPGFLEHTGEFVDDGLPEPIEEVADERAGIVTRLKHAITGDDLPPPSVIPTSSPVGVESKLHPEPRELDDDERRAAALLAKPVEPVPLSPPNGGSASAVGGQPPGAPMSQTPQAQAPQASKPRPRVTKQAPTRKINPGDLICGRCGEGNPDTRKFCRRCGETLVEAVVAKKAWYRSLTPSRKKKQVKAGDRPDRGTGRKAGTKARLFRGKVLGKFADVRRILAVLAVVGIGVGFAVPSARRAILDGGSDGLGSVRRTFSPTYSNIPIDPGRVSASTETPDGEAERVTDNNTLTYWLANESDPEASVTVVFVETTDVAHVLVSPGQQVDGGKIVRPDPRPREMLFRVTDESGTISEVASMIRDEDGFQTIDLNVDAAVSVETIVVNCYPDPVLTVCPVTELAFQSKD
jgi:ribosomal protein L40E